MTRFSIVKETITRSQGALGETAFMAMWVHDAKTDAVIDYTHMDLATHFDAKRVRERTLQKAAHEFS